MDIAFPDTLKLERSREKYSLNRPISIVLNQIQKSKCLALFSMTKQDQFYRDFKTSWIPKLVSRSTGTMPPEFRAWRHTPSCSSCHLMNASGIPNSHKCCQVGAEKIRTMDKLSIELTFFLDLANSNSTVFPLFLHSNAKTQSAVFFKYRHFYKLWLNS